MGPAFEINEHSEKAFVTARLLSGAKVLIGINRAAPACPAIVRSLGPSDRV
jgi:hypothetical protein